VQIYTNRLVILELLLWLTQVSETRARWVWGLKSDRAESVGDREQ
jgi:hypothetical protein